MWKIGLIIVAVGILASVILLPKPVSTELPQPTATPAPSMAPTPQPTKIPAPVTQKSSTGWRLTVYYTPVEKYHGGEEEHVPGIGSFPSDFLEIVRLEGVGKISYGPHAGKYLHQTDNLGYWLTDAPQDAQGKPLIPMKTAAAHSSIKFGSKVKILSCGDIPDTACSQLMNVEWVVNDRFQYQDSAKHLDLYIGEEDRENFLDSHPLIIDSQNAEVAVY